LCGGHRSLLCWAHCSLLLLLLLPHGHHAAIKQDLDNSWEVLAEPIQTVMRRYGVPEPYEKLKAFTRGQRVTQDSMRVRAGGTEGTEGIAMDWAAKGSKQCRSRAGADCLHPPTSRIQEFVAGLEDLPDAARAELQALTPMTYVGNAAQQAKQLAQHLQQL
jgi:adenylosuccinate lyase